MTSPAESLTPIYVGGCPRSGTTMMGSLLGGHPDVVTVPEAQFFIDVVSKAASTPDGRVDHRALLEFVRRNWRFRLWGVEAPDLQASGNEPVTAAEIIRHVVRSYASAEDVNKTSVHYWADHAPLNMQYIKRMLDTFPNARAIHLVRDGRAIMASVLPIDWGPNTPYHAASWWASWVAKGLAAEQYFGPERVIRVHYEQLVRDPQHTLEELCPKLGLTFDERMVSGGEFKVPKFTSKQHALVGQKPDQSRAEKWRRELTQRQIEVFEQNTGDLLALLGYELACPLDVPRIRAAERLKYNLVDIGRTYFYNLWRIKARRRKRDAAQRASAN